MAEKKRAKKGSIFWKIFAVWIVILAVACCVALYFGRLVMVDYDESQRFPYDDAVRLANEIAGGDYSLLYDREEFHNSMVFEKEEYERRIAEAVAANGGCDVKKGFSPDAAKNPTFIISAGEKKIATVVYERIEEKSEYGFDKYAFLSLTPFTEGSFGVKLLVPEDCDLILNGFAIGEEFRTGETVANAAPKDDIEKTGEVTSYYYYVEDLMEQPSFRIVYKDTKLDADVVWDDELKVFTTRKYETAAEAPSNYRIFVNGVEITDGDRFVVKNDIPIDEIEYEQKYTGRDLTMVTYHVSGLRYRDGIQITYKDFEGNEFTPEFSEKKQAYYCGAGITPKDLSAYGIDEEFLFTRAIGYARFINNDDPNGEDIKFVKSAVKQYFLPDSQAYNDLIDFWVVFSSHKEFWIENKSLDELVFYHEGLFRATVSFDYCIRGFNHQTDNEKKYETTVSFWYANVDGNWYIVDLALGGS